jgi:uncharacterized protein YqjF (DUF2071 family)
MNWIMQQWWRDLLFAHWPLPAETMRGHLPPQIEPDLFDGVAWIGVVPFRMNGIRFRYLPPIPGTSAFLELNVRTYATIGGKAGVYFFSLDAANQLAVAAARRWFHLPYFRAAMRLDDDGTTVRYRSTRTHAGAPPAELEAEYRPTGPVYTSREGDLDWWLTERYCLYAVAPDGRVLRGDIEHPRWPLQPAECTIARNTLSPVPLPDRPPLLHFARAIRARIRAPVPVA